MISFGNFGTGKILYSSLKVHCKSPHSWPSSGGKKQFLHSRLRRSWRNCFSPRLLTHSWWDLQCTFRDSQRILNSYTRGFATRIGNFQSQNCQMISLGHWERHKIQNCENFDIDKLLLADFAATKIDNYRYPIWAEGLFP